MRTPNAETQLRGAKREIARLNVALARTDSARKHEADEAYRQSHRAAVLQSDRDEWKARFDALLARVPLRAMGDEA